MNSTVLIVDDEEELVSILKDYLNRENINAVTAFNGEEAYAMFEKHKPNLVLLDIMLPDDDGMEICRSIRAISDIPIIMLSAKNTDMDKILSLGLGADEYLTKPYSPSVVIAHIKALLRRYRKQGLSNNEYVIHKGSFTINKKTHKVTYEDNDLNITGKEFEVLWLLVKNEGQVFTKEEIYDEVWGKDEFGEISTITVHIRKIRSKLEKGNVPQFLKTIWGVGYKFEHE